jgi:asparagine synthase (glutamine-hydrolysing)
MCGIAGFFTKAELDWRDCLRQMIGQLRHRGPDDAGEWIDPAAGVAFGHRRLSILDLSAQGHQPMVSPSGRYIIVYNGEVYNFADLRSELEKSPGATPRFRGHSDTEVILAAIDAWGLENAVRRFVGMFAFAVWDRASRTLSLVRDRIGEKPLFYGWAKDVFLFGSELKALVAHPNFSAEIDRDALDLLLRYDYVPAPHSIYEGIHKLLPGTIFRLSTDSKINSEPEEYWSPRKIFEAGARDPFLGSPEEAVEQLDAMLRAAVRDQMVADVPVGVLLSGGTDSSLITAMMQSHSASPVRSFTIGFDEEEVNEAVWARAVAAHLGTQHTELYIRGPDALDIVPELPRLYDEPFGDSSQIPTYLVARLASRHVSVCLSGDGGDELFGGYPHYLAAGLLSNKNIDNVPAPVRSVVARALNLVSSAPGWQALASFRRPRWEQSKGATRDRLKCLAQRFAANSNEVRYFRSRARWPHANSLVLGVERAAPTLTVSSRWARVSGTTRMMMYQDLIGYLPDDILVKVDRATMGVSLESRAPYLDHRIVEFAARLPVRLKIRGRQGKWLLRQLLDRYVPRNLVERPKQGFGAPIGLWLRGPLRNWAEALLDRSRLGRENYLDVGMVQRIWHEHLRGERNHSSLLWTILMFQDWNNYWSANRSSRIRDAIALCPREHEVATTMLFRRENKVTV